MERKTIFITGVSSGFGKLTVDRLVERGHRVIVGVRGGKERAATIFGRELDAVDLHMERPETFGAARALIDSKYEGKLDALINNAGFGMFGTVDDFSLEEIEYQFRVNVFGPIFLTQALLPALRVARGRIINISSMADASSMPFYSAYSASKAALTLFSEGMVYDLQRDGVHVCVVRPGGFKTEFSGRSMRWSKKSEEPTSRAHARVQKFLRVLEKANRRLADPAKVAVVVARLVDATSVPARVSIGADAKFMGVLSRLLSANARIPLLNALFKKVI